MTAFNQDLRQRSTPAEKFLWQRLRGGQLAGLKFRRQHSILSYIVDFYCHEAKLVIEVDGDVHYSPEAMLHDRKREQELESLGIRVIRFTNKEVLERLEDVLQEIFRFGWSSPSPQPSPCREREKSPPSTHVMAILNLTPDSFSDGGRLSSVDQAVEEAARALALGVAVLDIGGESTRPGAQEIPAEEECRRVIPALRAIHEAFPQAFLSIDTRKSMVAQAALEAGARMVNDVSGLRFDPAMARVVAEFDAELVLMHAQGKPEGMQVNPTYIEVVGEVREFLQRQVEVALEAGIRAEKIYVDPGFGFGKRLEDNLALLRRLEEITGLGFPVVVGTSRKSFLAMGDSGIGPEGREALTAASVAMAIERGAAMVRIHDPATQVPVVRLMDAMLGKSCTS